MYKPSRIIDSFTVAGFQYHDGALVLGKLKPGKKVKLVPEFDNPYDPRAIALYYKGTMIGYVPHSSNFIPAMLMAHGHTDVFECRVVQVDPEAEPAEQVRVALYVTEKKGK